MDGNRDRWAPHHRDDRNLMGYWHHRHGNLLDYRLDDPLHNQRLLPRFSSLLPREVIIPPWPPATLHPVETLERAAGTVKNAIGVLQNRAVVFCSTEGLQRALIIH